MSNIPTRTNGQIIDASHMNTLRDAIYELQTTPITTSGLAFIATADYRLIIADTTPNAVNIYLPVAADNAGMSYIIKTLEPLADYVLSNPVTLIGDVDGKTNLVLTENRQAVRLISSGSTWVIV